MTIRGEIAEPKGLAPTSAAVPVPLFPRFRKFSTVFMNNLG